MFVNPPDDMKMHWPELQGKDVEEARKVIQEECPDVHIQVLGATSPATMDYRLDRVRIIKDENNKVMMANRGFPVCSIPLSNFNLLVCSTVTTVSICLILPSKT
ncbi:uncharacterized protein [Blastocystis hominis]|uniref:Uncharacterized protein n=1 Tax=Blastocystis hominis TaxID=12968 RepID=D8M2N7_BLAHO|nr:uncharacterized protein [Blastocystis hominis]CBK22326.2 unnamed protein product [Blastocystis hominis]|eukprot:XP_012896374.1 uncharacterized protein [Blastocystis hominis]